MILFHIEYRMQGVIFQIFRYFSTVLSLYRHLFITVIAYTSGRKSTLQTSEHQIMFLFLMLTI